MGCGSCGTGGCAPTGCGDKGHCASGGCNRLNVHDWLSNLELPWNSQKCDVVEVQFKGNRKEFYRNPEKIELYNNDWVTVDAHYGYEVGRITLKGELVRLQMKRKKVKEDDAELRKVLRKSTDEERVKLTELRAREDGVLVRAREIIAFSTLPMKLSDVEFQADGSKIYFYYTAEGRIDFRDLIRRLSDAFRCRVEMKQIGPRQETARLGGLGVCGRELCCSSWLTDFKSVGSTAARYQNLSHNPAKLTGQCGRLKCCLNYELEVYLDALKAFPKNSKYLETTGGTYELVKTDIFKKLLWYLPKGRSSDHSDDALLALPVETVVGLLDDMKRGVKVESLQALSTSAVSMEGDEEEEPDYEHDSEGLVDRFDKSGRKNKKRKKRPGGQQTVQAQNQERVQPQNPIKEQQPSEQGPAPHKPNSQNRDRGHHRHQRNNRNNRNNSDSGNNRDNRNNSDSGNNRDNRNNSDSGNNRDNRNPRNDA
ncbi:MAG: stage 0 sporulation family protein [Bacteroidota bacterium]